MTGSSNGRQLGMAMGAVLLIVLMAALDATSISVTLPIMAKENDGTALDAFWAGTAFLLTSTVLQPNIGSFSIIFGRKPLLQICVAFFAAGAIVAAVAQDFTLILLGRAIQGVGGGGIIVLSEVLITDLFPLRERAKMNGLLSVMWSLGTIFGPLLGGGFAEDVSWRWIFWINIPFVVIGAPLIQFFLRLRFPRSSLLSKIARIDWFGSVLFVASATGFIIPVTWGGVIYPWDNWRTTVPLMACGFGLIIFALYEDKWAKNPLILTSVFKNRTAAIMYLHTFIHGIVVWGILYYLPLYFSAVQGYSPMMSGVALLVQAFTTNPAAIVTGGVITKTGRYRWAIWAGWGLMTAGVPVLVLLRNNIPVWQWILIGIPSGLGFGALFPSLSIGLQAATKPEDQAYALTMFTFFRAFGQTIGVAIGGVIFQNQIRQKLLETPIFAAKADELSKDAIQLVQVIKAMTDEGKQDQLRDAFVYGLQWVWIAMTALSGLALLASLFVEGLSLDQQQQSEQGFDFGNEKEDQENLVGIPLNAKPSQNTLYTKPSQNTLRSKASQNTITALPDFPPPPTQQHHFV